MAAFQKCIDINPSSKDYQAQYDQAKKDLYKGLSKAEISKIEGNEVRRTSKQATRSKRHQHSAMHAHKYRNRNEQRQCESNRITNSATSS